MSKSRSAVVDYLVYLIVRTLVCIFQAVPYAAACSLVEGLAWLMYHVDRRHRQAADDNLRHAFPDQFTPEERARLVRAVYWHFCTLMIEMMHIPRKIHISNWRQYLVLDGGKLLVDCLLSGRPLMLVTGHFGSWEMGGYCLNLLGFTTNAVARPLDNPYLDDFLRTFRQRTGQGILAKKGDFDRMQAILASQGVIATLGDQDAGQRGLFVDFFGRPASTHKAIALLALEYQVPLLVTGMRKIREPLCYASVIEDLILPEEYQGRPDAVRAITQRFTSGLERIVRGAPEQYFWLHRRWKHQPAAGRRRTAA